MDNTNQITYHKWTDEELAKVQRGITEYGHRWRLIQQNLLPHLPIQTIKNKFYSIEYKKDDTSKQQAKKKQHCCQITTLNSITKINNATKSHLLYLCRIQYKMNNKRQLRNLAIFQECRYDICFYFYILFIFNLIYLIIYILIRLLIKLNRQKQYKLIDNCKFILGTDLKLVPNECESGLCEFARRVN
ncbi:Conserved_hypothetical protein [Hexamita inflata]|uniref:Myb-like domain-containing protein n=1 Tax=Hexamita inflata TaxID=28002 RepID=A0AA86QAY9_9EUKA|nr:Conserved hypothetical protein [Hexamita inflata]